MKLILSAFCASFLVAPLAFSADCEKGKCDKKKEETLLAGKCKKDGDCDDEKAEGTLADCKKCDKKDEEKKEGTLA